MIVTPERWEQIDQLFQAASELAADERSVFLYQACGGDDGLRLEVESLLAFEESAEDFIGAPPGDVVASMLFEEQGQSMVGHTLGRYEIISPLGVGGMGEVYLAQDVQLNRKVALKLLPKKFTMDHEQVQRFKQEARSVSALNHPSIITIFEIGQADDLYFIATEFIDGQTLHQRRADAPIDLHEVLEIAIQVASALTAAHEAGIVHRDIKPANIMLRNDGFVKVLDFGLAKLSPELRGESSTAWDQVQTRPGWAIGTPRYMSPEQLLAEQVDGRSDIFSLGVVIYELVAGLAPFDGSTPTELISTVLTAEAPPLRSYCRGAPVELQRIVAKALAKNREKRYPTARDLLIDLKNLKLEFDLHARQSTQIGEPAGASRHDVARTYPCPQESLGEQLEPVGGAVPLESKLYIWRPTDLEFQSAIERQDSIVLVKGARQVGKTSLLARGLQRAREAGARVVVTDFQKLAGADLESMDRLLMSLAGSFADQLDLDRLPSQTWESHLSPGVNLERYFRRVVFPAVPAPIVWGLDEVDRLFTCPFGSEIFGLFRSWHNERALDPQGPWRRFTLAIAYATEAHLFITDLNQSPFNVGTRLVLGDLTFEQVSELNQRCGSILRDRAEVARYFRLVGGHPYLVRRGLHEMTAHGLKLVDLEAQADHDEGPFGDHLRRLFVSLTQDKSLCEVVSGVLQGGPCPTSESFYRLRSAGLIAGDSPRNVRPRCQIYAAYLERHLL